MTEPRQGVMTLMFDARINAMAKELSKCEPGELDQTALLALHQETCRLLRPAAGDVYEQTYGLPQEGHEG